MNAEFIARCYHEGALKKNGQKLTPAPGDHRTPEMVALVTASIRAREKLARTAPTTLAGIVVYLNYVLSESDNLEELLFEGEDDEGKDDFRDFVRSLARGARLIARKALQS